MRLKEIYNAADALAPFAISKAWIGQLGAYDNSGVMLDCGREIGGVLFSLDLTEEAVGAAKRAGANCIFTHHPAIWEKLAGITEATPTLMACVREGISVLSAHLNLDAAPHGIDESLMRGLGGTEALAFMEEAGGGAYGRVYEVKKSSLKAFAERAKQTFRTERVLTYGSGEVKRVASFCGAGFGEDSLAFALRNGADTLVSSDAKHHLIAGAVGSGLNVVLLTHYASEVYGFRAFYARMQEVLGLPCTFFEDEKLL